MTLTTTLREGQNTLGEETTRKNGGIITFLREYKDMMAVDIIVLYYHHFMAPTKLIESALSPFIESSLLLAQPPSFFFLSQNTSHLTYDSPNTQTQSRRTRLYFSIMAHADKNTHDT